MTLIVPSPVAAPARDPVQSARCPQCGQVAEAGTRHCAGCGTGINPVATSPAGAGEPEWLRKWQRLVARARRWWGMAQRYLLQDHNQLWWDRVACLGGGGLGFIWMISAWIRQAQHGWQTGLLIAALPWLLTKLRPQIDRLLTPLQKYRERIPRWGLITIGIVGPLGITTMLLRIGAGWMGFSDERCIQFALLLGTAAATAVLRNPVQAADPSTVSSDPSVVGRKPS
jgi:hypothetical protein